MKPIATLFLLCTVAITGCTTPLETQREIVATEPLEIVNVAGTLDPLQTCLLRSGAPVALSREGDVLYVVPLSSVAQIQVLQIAPTQLHIEHRALHRTIQGWPYGWEYLDMVKDCVAVQKVSTTVWRKQPVV